MSFTPRNLEYFQGTERSIGMGGAYIDPADFTLRGLKVHFINMKIQGGIQAADVFPYYHLVRDAILRNQRPPKHIPLLGVHLDTMPLVELLNTCDLSKQWTRRLYESMGVAQHSLLVVSKRMLFTSAHGTLCYDELHHSGFKRSTCGCRTASEPRCNPCRKRQGNDEPDRV